MSASTEGQGLAGSFFSTVAALARPAGREDAARRITDQSLLEQCLRLARTGVIVSTVFAVFFQAAAVAVPLFLGLAVDRGVVARDLTTTAVWAGVILALGIVVVVGECGMRWWARISSDESTDRLRVRITRHLITLDTVTLEQYGHGDIASRGIRDLDLIKAWLNGLPSFISGSLGFAAIIVGIAVLDPVLGLVALATVPLLLLARIAYRRRIAPVNQAIAAALADTTEAVEDVLTATSAVRGIGGETVLVERHHGRSAQLTRRVLRAVGLTAVWTSLPDLMPALGTAVGLAIGGLAVLNGRASVGDLVAFVAWMGMLAAWTSTLTMRTSQLSQARLAARRVAEVLRLRPAFRSSASPTPLPISGTLIANGITSRRGDHVVGPFDFAVDIGEIVAVTGPIGSGKSELLRLLSRLKDPSSGQVTFAGVDLRDADLDETRDRITLVPQRPLLVSGTLGDNLRLGRDDLTDAQLHDACYVAALDTFVASLPEGFDTPVGERGSMLSGGQRQRVAVARALLRDPSVLLLDDATSAVDVDTEAVMLVRLRYWMTRRYGRSPASIVLVSHRPGVLAAASPVVQMSDLAPRGRRRA